MTQAAERSPAAEPPAVDAATARKRLVEDLALLVIALSLLVIPAWFRSTPAGPVRIEDRGSTPVRIDVNSAPWYEWTLLDGVGEARARGIVEYRDASGPFRSIDDLKNVPRMPAGWVDKAAPYLEVRGK